MTAGEPPRLDARGTLCPLPVLLTARRLAALAPGDRLLVLGDDPGILHDLPAWCADTGHRLVDLSQEGGEIRALVEKAGDGP